MKANELRIGNLVKINVKDDQSYVGAVSAILSQTEIRCGSSGGILIPIDAVEGIELTPELLKQCGFKQEKQKNFSIAYMCYTDEDEELAHENEFYQFGNEIEHFYINGPHGDDKYQFFAESQVPYCNGMNVTVKYLHHLQNLYFAIAGEELDFNPQSV